MMMKASTKKRQVTAWSGMQSPNKKTGVGFWRAVLWKSVSCLLVDLRHRLRTLSTVSFADMIYELSFSFSAQAPIETYLSLLSSSLPNKITCNVLMTFV